ncbi:hypothetical protein TNCV_3929341 [Trichonephila clavipes]|nr:hypothetical protein TNCV_3929341 [Trichonephila clavipes]
MAANICSSRKILLHRPWYPHIVTEKVMSGLPTLQFRNQIIPRGMCIGQAEPLNEGHLCVISDTSGCLDDQQETSESQMNCSLMMSPELSDEQRNKLSELLRNFWAFHEDRQVDSREDECETQDFYW